MSKKRHRIKAGWITLGSHEDEDGNRAGGAKVFVDGSGDITKGPPSLKGDSVASLKDKSRNAIRNTKREHARAENKTGHDVTRSQAQSLGNETRQKQHHAARDAGRGAVATHQVLRTMREAHQFLTDQHEQREAAKKSARKTTGLNAGVIAKYENTYHDHTAVPRFDETSRSFAAEHPELGFDPDAHDTPDKVWEFIREGSADAPALHSKEVADLAVDWLRSTPKPRAARSIDKPSKRARQTVDETVPFRRSKDRLRCGRMLFSGNVSLDRAPTQRLRGRARRRQQMFRTFEGVAYNGGLMFPTITVGGKDLSKTPIVLDLDSLTIPDQVRPVLDDHDETTEGVIGQTTSIAIKGYTLPVRGVLYTQKPRSQKILAASDGGHLWQLSVGVDFEMEDVPAGRQVYVNGQTFTGPLKVARNGYLTDLSYVAVGGDDTTWATIAARRLNLSRIVAGLQRLRAASKEGFSMKTFEEWLMDTYEISDKSTLSATQLGKYKAIYDAEMRANDNEELDDDEDEELDEEADDEDEDEELEESRSRRQPASAAARRKSRTPQPRARGKASRGGRRYAGSDGASADGSIETRVRNTVRLEARREARRESERQIRINAMAGDNTALAQQAIREGWSANRFELTSMRAARATQSGAATKPDDDEPLLIEAALLVHGGMNLDRVGKFFDETVMNRITAQRYRGLSLVEAADRIRLRAGVHCEAARNQQAHMIACRNANARLEANGFTSMTLGSILENAADKILLDAYQSIETMWQNFCAIRSLNDFKVHSQYALDPLSVFQKVGAQGDFAQLQFGDRKYSLQADSYGVRFKIDFQTWRNDDLGAINNRISSLGELAASTVEQVFWVLFMSGINNTSMFHANNRNYDATASSIFGIAGLTFAETMWGNQVRPNGTPLGIKPQTLGVGTSLKTTAGTVFTSAKLNEVFDSTNNTRKGPVGQDNPHIGKYKPYECPYMSNTLLKDTTGAKPAVIAHQDAGLWALAARQGNNAPFHVGFLDGQQAPTVQIINNQAEMIGFELAAGFHFGVGFGDPMLAMAFNPNNA